MNDNEDEQGDPNEVEMMSVTTRMQVLGERVLTPDVCAELVTLAQKVLDICVRQRHRAEVVGDGACSFLKKRTKNLQLVSLPAPNIKSVTRRRTTSWCPASRGAGVISGRLVMVRP